VGLADPSMGADLVCKIASVTENNFDQQPWVDASLALCRQ